MEYTADHWGDNMIVWKLCIALIREYGFFAKLNDVNFNNLRTTGNKTIKVPLLDGDAITVEYKDIDSLLRTIDPHDTQTPTGFTDDIESLPSSKVKEIVKKIENI